MPTVLINICRKLARLESIVKYLSSQGKLTRKFCHKMGRNFFPCMPYEFSMTLFLEIYTNPVNSPAKELEDVC